MNVGVRTQGIQVAENSSRLLVADCDIHPRQKSRKDLYPYLAQRWQDYDQTFGGRPRQPYRTSHTYPKGQPGADRRDARTPDGGRPGSDVHYLGRHLLDANNTQLGILNATSGDNGQSNQNRELAAALCRASNQWLMAEWLTKEPRLKASLVVPFEDTKAAVAEIEHWAGNPHFAQVLFLGRTSEPMGQKRYWPIFEAAAAAGWPIGVHAFGHGGFPSTGSGWPSYYIEDMSAHAQAGECMITSLVTEGVFARIPDMRLVLIEASFSWVPPLKWRLDKLWKRLKAETPFLTRAPSEYIHDHVWFTSQPMEEPTTNEHLLETMEWIGWDRLLFATDYPHWDYDDPAQVSLLMRVDEEKRRGFFLDNALKLYGMADATVKTETV